MRRSSQFLPDPTPRVRLLPLHLIEYKKSRSYKKSFKDDKVVKEALVEAADAFFGEFKSKTEIVAAIKDMQLSRNTITRQCE